SYLLMHLWLKLGTGEVWLRIFSIFWGVLSVFGVYLISKNLVNRNFGIFTSFLLAIAPYHIYYSQEVRMYSQIVALGVFSYYFFLKVLDNNRVLYSLGYILSSAALIYTFYPSFFLLLSQVIYIFIHQRKNLKQFILPYLIIIIIWIPWVPYFLSQLKGGINADEYLPGWGNLLSLPILKALPITFFKFSMGRIGFENEIAYLVVAAMVLLVYGILLFKGLLRSMNSANSFLIYWFCLPLVITFFISLKIPFNQPFRLLYILPAFYILISLGIWHLNYFRKIAAIVVIGISLWGLGLYYTQPRFWREDWRSSVEYVNKSTDEESAVVFLWNQPFDPYLWYGGKSGKGIVSKFPASEEGVDKNLVSIKNSKKIFVYEYLQDLSDPNRFTQRWLTEHSFTEVEKKGFNGIGFVSLYIPDVKSDF
ncbi:MAG: glycosyltransferase family 39 protein, partial [Candidatus Daviesbacteria bacterium]|nr:glycosyltransferase family 39 protein [Candidatus Daviesbacteria bacterium]